MFLPRWSSARRAAKLEAQIIDLMKPKPKAEKEDDNTRRKWDCFHIPTAMCLGCKVLYSIDQKMLNRRQLLKIRDMDFLPPKATEPSLFTQSPNQPES